MSSKYRAVFRFSGVTPATLFSGSRWAARSRRTSIWILESGMTRSLNLFRQFPSFAVTFNTQGTRHHQRILPGRFLKKTLVPEGTRAVLLEGLPVKTCEVWLCRFCAHNTHTTTTLVSNLPI